MKSFHTRLWMKWEPGDSISPRARSLPAELLIFSSGAEIIFCPSFFTANQCRTILSLCLHFLSRSEKPPSHEFKAGAQMRWAPLVRNYISARLSHVPARNTSEREGNIFVSGRWPCSAVKGLREGYCNTYIHVLLTCILQQWSGVNKMLMFWTNTNKHKSALKIQWGSYSNTYMYCVCMCLFII